MWLVTNKIGNQPDVVLHSSGPIEDIETNNNNNNTSNKEETHKKNIKGKLKKLVRRKSATTENYALPLELREQLKQIYETMGKTMTEEAEEDEDEDEPQAIIY
ncbi:hypothetical protein RUM43_001071 [Polyplax serrata]|uniref:Uncharacterized protein n=1 Tax=Polyplax serrata TaxID=468196 RepID=A0AAN8XP33_POLSC